MITLIAAAAKNRVIGMEGQIPWSFKEDMIFFKQTTLHHACIMGRKTFDSLPRPLDRRLNIILTHNVPEHADQVSADVVFVTSIGDALDLALDFMRESQTQRVFVMGGETIYTTFLPLAHELIITQLNELVSGDTHFPTLDDTWFHRESTPLTSRGEVRHYIRRPTTDVVKLVHGELVPATSTTDPLLSNY